MADDTTLFLKNDKSLTNALDIIDKFRTCSGLKLNISKTELFYLENTNHRQTVNNITPTSKFKALGIIFTHNIDEMNYSI